MMGGSKETKRALPTIWSQISIMCWRDLKLKQRHYKRSIAEILLPIALAFFIWYESTASVKTDHFLGQPATTPVPLLMTTRLLGDSSDIPFTPSFPFMILYSPDTPAVSDILEKAKTPLGFSIPSRGFATEKDLDQYVAAKTEDRSKFIGVVFSPDLVTPSQHYAYKLRLSYGPSPKKGLPPSECRANSSIHAYSCTATSYLHGIFLDVQNSLVSWSQSL